MANLEIVPASNCKNVAAQHVEMMVPLYSYGCGKKIKKAFAHLKGIHSVDVEYSLQKVTVWGICNKYDVLATMRKKRREARFWDDTDQKEEAEEEDRSEKEMEGGGEEGDEVRRPPAKVPIFKFTKSWKKKFLPLMLYLNN